MAALSFNSQKLNSSSFGKKLVSCLIVVVIFALGGTAGYLGNNKVQAMKTAQVNEAGRNYVSAILSGDLDNAYAMSSSELQKNQTKEDYIKTLKDLKTSDILLTDEQAAFSDQGVSYSVVANNLPPNPDGATDGLFTLILVNENGWKAKTVDVQ